MPKHRYTIDQAIELVERHHRETAGRRQRQNDDYKLQRNDPYDTNVDAEGTETGKDFKSVTSTVAGAFVKKVVSVLAGSKLLIQIPYGKAQREQRQVFDIKERFAYGLLQQAEEELISLIEIGLHDQISWFGPNRGWICGKFLLRNTAEDGAAVSIRPWDPLNTYWQVGKDGLDWACLKVRMKLADVRAEWPDAALEGQDEDERDVYDFWDTSENFVFTSEKESLKRRTSHGSPRTPIVIIPVPTQPRIWSDDVIDAEDDYGESVLATNRGLYDQISEIMSVTLDLLERARDPSSLVFTEEEDTELDADPNQDGGVHYLGKEDRFQQLAPPETTKDAIQLMTMVMGMVQRGDLPFSTYGDIQFALSGYAITQLNQQMLTVIGPQTRAMARWYAAGLNLLVDQYVSGAFNPITIRGGGNNRDYMQITVPPEALKNLPPYDVRVVGELPEDDVAKLNAMQLARQGDRPLLPDRWLRDNVGKYPNADLIEQELKEQEAERSHPLAVAMGYAEAALQAKRVDLYQVWIAVAQQQMIQLEMQKQMMLAGIPPGGGGQGGQNNQGTPEKPGGLPSQVLPIAAQQGSSVPNPSPPTGAEGRFGLTRVGG